MNWVLPAGSSGGLDFSRSRQVTGFSGLFKHGDLMQEKIMKKVASLLVSLLFAAWIAAGIGNGRAYGQAVTEVASATAKVFFERLDPDQREWLKATPEERIRISERIGETGAARWAEEQGLQRLPVNKTIPQGVDLIYRAPDGTIYVIEAKGGTSPLGRGYGHIQGTPEWAVEAIKRMLRDPNIDPATKEACEAVLKAAKEGRLKVVVVRTPHVLGKPGAPIVEQIFDVSDEAARKAKEALDAIRKGGAAGAALTKTRSNSGTGEGGTISGQPEKPTSANTKPVGTTKLKGEKAATAAAESTLVVPRRNPVIIDPPFRYPRPLGTAIWKGSAVVGAVVDACDRVHDVIETEGRYGRGEITAQEREIAHAENAAGYVGGWGGALIGAKVGGEIGGVAGTCVAPGPGTGVGATIGALTGAVAGYFGGEEAAKLAAERTMQAVHSSGTTVAEWGYRRWEDVKDAGRWTYRKAADAWHWITGD